jgi:hypothetical protein
LSVEPDIFHRPLQAVNEIQERDRAGPAQQ